MKNKVCFTMKLKEQSMVECQIKKQRLKTKVKTLHTIAGNVFQMKFMDNPWEKGIINPIKNTSKKASSRERS